MYTRTRTKREMGKLPMILMVFSVVIAILPVAQGIAEDPEAVEAWFEKLGQAKENVTKLHFYFHDIVTGKNPTAIQVAQSNLTAKSPTLFGLVRMFDNILTEGPEPTSQTVGRAQGFYGSAGLEELSMLMTMNLVFTQGNYNGSTLSFLARNPALNPHREMPVVGGSGVFRLARGIATATTYSMDFTTGNAIVEYNVMVMHY
ncbi:dirigent protein 23-like [Cornus florida]|uniref:dirigent protein 23-like n=1 Tax=Cornus florida TaxID=4283 RepID=UPI0028A0CF70|nr:dirigent protein 23-like [Cornus florida]